MVTPHFIYKETKGQMRSVTVKCPKGRELTLSTHYVSVIFRYIF